MAWILRDDEIAAVLQLDGGARYSYCVKKITDEKQLWSLMQDDGWALMADDTDQELIPIWPHEKFATLCATGFFADHQPKSIAIDTWLERWIPGMEKDGRIIAVFPTAESKGVLVDPRRFEADIREELLKYE
jgi:hypothetical protein